MSQMIKAKSARQKEMMNNSGSNTSSKGFFGFNNNSGRNTNEMSKEEMWRNCLDKASVMKQIIDKKVYSNGPLYNREVQTKKVALEKKYRKKDELATMSQQMHNSDSRFSLGQTSRLHSGQSDNESMLDSVSNVSVAGLTFKDLIEHVGRIERNYQALQENVLDKPVVKEQ